jgi:hypothetical protein
MRRLVFLLSIIFLGITFPCGTTALQAQSSIPAALVGGVAGAGSGGYIGIAVIVAESRAGRYMHSFKDELGLHSLPVLIGGGTGIFLGATAPDRLYRTILYGSFGTLAGTGAGVVVGKLVWKGPEAKWAGGAIGAGVGMAIGSTLGVFLPLHKKKSSTQTGTQANVREYPLTFTIRF